jgi:uncharacterized protein (TIGR03435 family)
MGRLAPLLGLATMLAAVAVDTRALATQAPATQTFDPTVPQRFEVASVRPNVSGNPGGSLRRQPGGRMDAVNMPLRMLILFAYQLQQLRLVGGPDWMATDRFDIAAKLEGDPPPADPRSGPDALALALRTLLADRFNLKVHYEMRELDIFALVPARSAGNPGPVLERSMQDCSPAALRARGSEPPPAGAAGASVFCGMQLGPGRLRAGGMPLSQVANTLSGLVGRVVVDRTGLSGNWDFELVFDPSTVAGVRPGADFSPSAPDAPSIFTAIQEQLGLKLEPTKGPAEVLVVDSVERPTPD